MLCSRQGSVLGVHDTVCPIIPDKFDHLVKMSVCQISLHAPQQSLTQYFIIHW